MVLFSQTVKRLLLISAVTSALSLPVYANSVQGSLSDVKKGGLVIQQKDSNGNPVDMPPPQLGIAPPQLDLSGTARVDGSVTIYNYGTEPKKMNLDLVDIERSGKPISSNKHTLKQWAVFAPRSFEIPVGGYQTVRVSFRLPSDFPHKTHYALLAITQEVDNQIVSQENALTTMKIGSSYHLPVRVQVGK